MYNIQGQDKFHARNSDVFIMNKSVALKRTVCLRDGGGVRPYLEVPCPAVLQESLLTSAADEDAGRRICREWLS